MDYQFFTAGLHDAMRVAQDRSVLQSDQGSGMKMYPRNDGPGGLYEVTLFARGCPAFKGWGERAALIESLIFNVLELGGTVKALCVIEDTAKAIISLYRRPPSRALERVARTFSECQPSPLRFRVRQIRSKAGLLLSVQRVHMMPVYAGVADHPGSHLDSTYRTYLGDNPMPGISTELVLDAFNDYVDREAAFAAWVTRDLLPAYDERRKGVTAQSSPDERPSDFRLM